MADEPAGSPLWWLRRLHAQLIARRPTLQRAASYYEGAHNLQFASRKFLDAFGGLFRAFADNWCGVVVDAVEERLNPNGFRVGDQPEADEDAWRIWQANEMDAQSQLAHTEALAQGVAYAVVWTRDGDVTPEITVESGINTIVACHPKMRRRRQAALRMWVDDFGYRHAEVFLPDDVWLFRSKSPASSDPELNVDAANVEWVPDVDVADVDEAGRMPNPLGQVPVVELLNKPRLWVPAQVQWAAHSEIAPIIPLQDAVNKLIADMVIASEFAAYRQRWATGFELEEDPKTGQAKPPAFEPGPGAVWTAESEETKFGQFEAADLSNFVKAIDMVIQHIASISRTPPHYLNASADRLSGESIKAAETGLVAKVKRKQRHFGEAWEDVMRLAGQVAGHGQLANAVDMETIWADPESRTESEHVDAVIKKMAIGVPLEQLWEDAGYSPQQIERFHTMRARQAFLTAFTAPQQQPQALELPAADGAS